MNWKSNYESRDDLHQYGSNGLALYALSLRFGVEDLDLVASEAITDGPGDKKCDMVYSDFDKGISVIAQCYGASPGKERKEASANKASDLTVAVNWLLNSDEKDIPERIKSAALELRRGIDEGKIQDVYVWYVHNLPESENVKTELKVIESNTHATISHVFAGKDIQVHVKEVGENTFEEWYRAALTPILVNEEFAIKVACGYEIESDNWKAYVTAVPARFLFQLHKKHKTDIFSANVRDYLGSRQSDSNINNGIKNSAGSEPKNFWVYNNGLTILTNSFKAESTKKGMTLKVSGLSIVNGAQTTGALGSLRRAPSETAYVPVRFITTADKNIIQNIIRYNNSQNQVTASDFRSTDSIQKKLRDEFSKIPDAEYEGGRRGGADDRIRRRPNLLSSYTVGQALTAFHGDPVVAYNQKSNIWSSDKLYNKVFNEETSAYHIIFCFSLLRAIENRKVRLKGKLEKHPEGIKTAEENEIDFLRKRGATFLLVTGIAKSIESVLKKRINNQFKVSFNHKITLKQATQCWDDVLDPFMAFAHYLSEGVNDGLKNNEHVNKAVQQFVSLVAATLDVNAAIYQRFAENVWVNK